MYQHACSRCLCDSCMIGVLKQEFVICVVLMSCHLTLMWSNQKKSSTNFIQRTMVNQYRCKAGFYLGSMFVATFTFVCMYVQELECTRVASMRVNSNYTLYKWFHDQFMTVLMKAALFYFGGTLLLSEPGELPPD